MKVIKLVLKHYFLAKGLQMQIYPNHIPVYKFKHYACLPFRSIVYKLKGTYQSQL